MISFCSKCIAGLWEVFHRIRLALTILAWGQLSNGALGHLRAARAEIEYIQTHKDDLSKEEILDLISGTTKKANTGIQHHLGHALSADIWRQVNAQMVEAELIDLRRSVANRIRGLTGRNEHD